jgi:hypothetical protein
LIIVTFQHYDLAWFRFLYGRGLPNIVLGNVVVTVIILLLVIAFLHTATVLHVLVLLVEASGVFPNIFHYWLFLDLLAELAFEFQPPQTISLFDLRIGEFGKVANFFDEVYDKIMFYF